MDKLWILCIENNWNRNNPNIESVIMNDERKFNIEDFDEYIRQGDPDKKENAYI